MFITLAVAKPWGAPAGDPAGSLAAGPATFLPAGSPLPARSGSAATEASVEPVEWVVHPPFIPGPRPLVSAASGRSVIGARDGWGVRAVIETGAGSGGGAIAAHVITAWLPTAVAIGVAGPSNLAIHGARLVRLMPGSGTGTRGADNLTRPIVDLLSNRPYRQAIRFEEPDGRAWEPGVYAVFAEGNGSAGNDVFA